MQDIVEDLSPARLASAIEQNLYSWIPVFGAAGEVRSNDPRGVSRSLSPVTLPLFNSVMDTRLEPENVNEAIQRIKADAQARQVPVLWWVGPSTRPTNLGQQLVGHGFAVDEDGPGMAVELAGISQHSTEPKGLSIARVLDEGTRREWSRAMGLGFEVPASIMDYFVDIWSGFIRQVGSDSVQAYLARLDGQPVATSLLLLGAGVAGIYAVATIPAARRQGIGALITQYPLLQARTMGYKIGILQSSPMGLRVYQSLGFKEYCRITSYVYRPIK